jgi:hypothetical protein
MTATTDHYRRRLAEPVPDSPLAQVRTRLLCIGEQMQTIRATPAMQAVSEAELQLHRAVSAEQAGTLTTPDDMPAELYIEVLRRALDRRRREAEQDMAAATALGVELQAAIREQESYQKAAQAAIEHLAGLDAQEAAARAEFDRLRAFWRKQLAGVAGA